MCKMTKRLYIAENCDDKIHMNLMFRKIQRAVRFERNQEHRTLTIRLMAANNSCLSYDYT